MRFWISVFTNAEETRSVERVCVDLDHGRILWFKKNTVGEAVLIAFIVWINYLLSFFYSKQYANPMPCSSAKLHTLSFVIWWRSSIESKWIIEVSRHLNIYCDRTCVSRHASSEMANRQASGLSLRHYVDVALTRSNAIASRRRPTDILSWTVRICNGDDDVVAVVMSFDGFYVKCSSDAEMSRLCCIRQGRLSNVHPDNPVDGQGQQVGYRSDEAFRMDSFPGDRRQQLDLAGSGQHASPAVAGPLTPHESRCPFSGALHRSRRHAEAPWRYLQTDQK